jgi:hypothetical protein
VTAAGSGERWVRRPEGSNWGEFGPDDQLGRMNLVVPEKVKQGIAEVREGPYLLPEPAARSCPVETALNPRRHPPVIRPTLRNGRPNMSLQADGRRRPTSAT